MQKPKLIPYNDSVFLDYHDNLEIICKEHMIKTDDDYGEYGFPVSSVTCPEGHTIHFSTQPDEIKKLISRRLESKMYQDADYFDIDGYLVPASKEDEVKVGDSEYFAKAQVKNSEKKGVQVVVYAGKKGQKDKAQIFIDPENRKMTFDQTNLNPNDVFVKLEATFRDGSRTTIEGSSPEKNL